MASYYSGLLQPFTQSFVPAHFNNHFFNTFTGGRAMSWENQLPVLFSNRSVESQIDRPLNDAIHSVNGWSQS